MADAAVADAPPTREPPPPLAVAYDPITGIPAEFNEYLPTNCDEYKRWKAASGAAGPATTSDAAPAAADGASAEAVTAGMAGLAVGEGGEGAPAAAGGDAAAAAAAAAPPPPKKSGKKKKGEPEVVLEITARGRKKSVTIISGMDTFGIKLGEASKLLGKKFACGSSVTKTAEGKEQVEVQGDVAARAAALILSTYAKDAANSPAGVPLEEGRFFIVESKKRRPAFGEAE